MEVLMFILPVLICLNIPGSIGETLQNVIERLDILEEGYLDLKVDFVSSEHKMTKKIFRAKDSLRNEIKNTTKKQINDALSDTLRSESIDAMIKSQVISETRHLKLANHQMRRELDLMKKKLGRVQQDNTRYREAVQKATLVLPDDLCPILPDMTNAALSTGGQKIGTSRTYTCNDEYLDTETFLTSAVITCLPDKTWSPVTLNCSGPYVKREIVSDSSYIFHNIEADVLNRLKGSTPSLVYLVKTCHDGNFLLHENLDYSTGTKYEITIGGWTNTQSVIVKGMQGTQLDLHVESGMLSCTEFRPFWLSWNNSIITVGKGSIVGSQEILRWTPSPPMLFNFVSYSSYIKSPGIWYFLVQS